MTKCKHFFLLAGFILAAGIGSLYGQSELRRADEWYRNRAYSRAIPVYEAALRERFRTGTAQKLVNCYRLTGHWVRAEALLDTLVDREKVREEMWFIYGEALMSNGKYDRAREWFLRYADAVPEDTLALVRAEACLLVATIPPYFGQIAYRELPFNSDGDDHAAIPWEDGLLFTSDRSPGLHLLKEKSEWTGRDYLSLFFTRPETDSTWQDPARFSTRINEINVNVGYASAPADTSILYFTRNALEPNKRGLYPLQIYAAVHERGGGWSRPHPVSFSNPETNMMHPAVSADGGTLVFVSDRGDGEGGLDLWSSLQEDGQWTKPANLGPVINTSGHEAFPWFAPDGRLFFASKGHPGFGGYDLFVTSLDPDGMWTAPVNLGRPLNSPLDDITFCLDRTGAGGFFSSTRDGGDDDLYQWWSGPSPFPGDR